MLTRFFQANDRVCPKAHLFCAYLQNGHTPQFPASGIVACGYFVEELGAGNTGRLPALALVVATYGLPVLAVCIRKPEITHAGRLVGARILHTEEAIEDALELGLYQLAVALLAHEDVPRIYTRAGQGTYPELIHASEKAVSTLC